MAKFISPSRRCLKENAPLYFPFCATNSRNVLQDYKGSQRKEIKILFLGCKDMMDVLTTIASNSYCDGHMTMHLNHSCPLTFARTILILKVISANEFNVNELEDISYLWDLWYNVVWPKSTLDRFVMDVKELLDRGLPNNWFFIKSDQLDELKDVWRGWLLSLDKKLIDSSQIEKVVKVRSEFISNGGRFGKQLLNKLFSLKLIDEAPTIEKISLMIVSKMEIEDFPFLLKKKLEHEVDTYFETGNCRSSEIPSKAALNPTLLEPKTHRWLVNIYSCPFDAYLPLPWSEFETTSNDPTGSELTQYCQKVLKNLVVSYRNLIKFPNFYFCWSDKLEYFHMELAEKFDVIDCSSPAEELGLPNIFAYCNPRLSSPEALLITESSLWTTLASSIAQHVEKTLCAPVSMIPTLYGFRIKNSVDLGCLTLTKNQLFGSFSPIRFTWSPAPQFKNVPFCVSPSIEVFLKKLQKKCYFMDHSNGGQHLKENVCFKAYTPLTFSLVASRLTQNERKKKNPFQHWTFWEVAPQFKLAQRAANDWAGYRPVRIVTTVQPFTHELKTLFNKTKILFRAPNLRLILIPSNHLLKINLQLFTTKESEKKYPINWADQNPDVHYIDNFDLIYHKNEAGRFRSLQLSFFLPQKHDLTSDHCAVLIELYTGSLMMTMGALAGMEQQLMKKPCLDSCPFSSVFPKFSQDLYLETVKCQESENEFVVEVGIICKDVPKGLSFTTDREPPCEAAHQITFSLSEPEGIKPLTLCFPHPFMVDSIVSTLCHSDRCIRVSLKKALREPWPASFSEKPKWDVEKSLSEWKQSPTWKGSVSELMFHVAEQKTSKIGKHLLGLGNLGSVMHIPELRQLSPLDVVRNVIGIIFNYFEQGFDIFLTFNVSSHQSFAEFVLDAVKTKEPEFAIRAHRPILLSPCGSPMLLISVLDCRLSEKLVDKGHLKTKTASEYLKRVFVQKKSKQGPMFMNTTVEGGNLLRYVLRLNSTKMKPSSWQENNLPLGKYSPFLTTYISPLYREKSSYLGEEEDAQSKTSDEVFYEASDTLDSQPNPCAVCGKHLRDKFKRCSRCKNTAYCTVECQRSDWRKHKLVCAKSNP